MEIVSIGENFGETTGVSVGLKAGRKNSYWERADKQKLITPYPLSIDVDGALLK